MLQRRKARGFRAKDAYLGPSRKAIKRKEDREEAAWIVAMRLLVFARDRVCRCCGGRAEAMHEIKTRAMMRGMCFRLIFTLSNCLMLCELCHRRVHKRAVTCALGKFWIRIIGQDANVPGGVSFERVED